MAVGKHSVAGGVELRITAIACLADDCGKLNLDVALQKARYGKGIAEILQTWRLLPESSAKPQPDYIPEPIRQTYLEACRIRDMSPQASATLSRRCLQGMIRDFCGISRKRLVDEINALRTAVNEGKAPAGVQPDTIDAIDHVRNIGNIGAHMEADINVIVDVDPDEAQQLIGLLELLIDEWYVARQVRRERLKAIGLVAAEKKAAQDPKPA